MSSSQPTVLGLTPSFGFGDRLGLATPGHAAALKRTGSGIPPIFAQQSIREMARTNRQPTEVMADALAAPQGRVSPASKARMPIILKPRTMSIGLPPPDSFSSRSIHREKLTPAPTITTPISLPRNSKPSPIR